MTFNMGTHKISPDPSLLKRGNQLAPDGALFSEKRDKLLQALQDRMAVGAGLDVFGG